MNTTLNRGRPISAAALAALLSLALLSSFFSGCNGWYRLVPGTPSGSATGKKGDTAAITISWSAVGNAGVYYIYRSDAAGGEYKLIAQTDGLEYVDTGVQWDRWYYYKLSAGDFWGHEGSPSPVFSGINYQYRWDAVPTTLAARGSEPQIFSIGQILYLSYLDADRAIRIRAWEPGNADAAKQWTDPVASPGRVKSGGRYHLIRSNQTWYAAFQDYDDVSLLRVLTFNTGTDAWESLGDIYADCVTTGFDNDADGTANVWANFTSLTDLKIRRIGETVYVAVLEASRRLFVLHYNAALGNGRWIHNGEAPFAPNAANALPSQSVFAFDAVDNRPTVAYTAGGLMELRTWAGSGWTDLPALVPAGATSDSDNLVLIPSGLYLSYENSTGAITTVARSGQDWTDLGASGLSGSGGAANLAGVADGRNSLHLFVPAAAGFSSVRYKPKSATDETDTAEWIDTPDPTGIQGAPGRFAAAAIAQEIYIVYEENSGLNIVCYR